MSLRASGEWVRRSGGAPQHALPAIAPAAAAVALWLSARWARAARPSLSFRRLPVLSRIARSLDFMRSDGLAHYLTLWDVAHGDGGLPM